ncbi:MAG: hypothetical protein ACTSXD_01025 [Candidatus Heimdallarchaeaceae archaeon]
MFDINSLSDSIVNLLDKNNTTTSSYDISDGLAIRVKQIKKGYSKATPIPIQLYPTVFVELQTKKEEFSQLGKSSRRKVNIVYDIVPVVYYKGREESDEQLLLLVQNIENLLRNKIDLSATVDFSVIEATDFDVIYRDDIWNSVAKITLNIEKTIS